MQRRRHAPYTSRDMPPPLPSLFLPYFFFVCACTLWLGSSSGHACGRRSNRPRVFHSNYSAPSNYQIASDGVASKRDRGWTPSFFHPFRLYSSSSFNKLRKLKDRIYIRFPFCDKFPCSFLFFFLLKKEKGKNA